MRKVVGAVTNLVRSEPVLAANIVSALVVLATLVADLSPEIAAAISGVAFAVLSLAARQQVVPVETLISDWED